ncbi:L,D-transpeptidase family protein [Sphingomonas sabuli]|nr:L,D-transpeptidase family protein [Sphingomonas sabuli]
MATFGTGAAHAAEIPSASLEVQAKALPQGQYFWASNAPQNGPLLLTIDLTEQRIRVYRDGVLFAASATSTGSEGRETPTGVFTILEKQVEHRSSTYDNAPMPFMQRLTEKGVAIHSGNLPGYAASHGCIRLPDAFARKLFAITEIGTPVMITDSAQIAERERIEAEYRKAQQDYAQTLYSKQAAAKSVLTEHNRAKAEHQRAMEAYAAEFGQPEKPRR